MQIDNSDEKALGIHREAVVIEAHTDIMVDVVLRQRRGEKNVLQNIYLPKMKKAGIDFSVLVVGGDHTSLVSLTDYPVHTFAAIQTLDRLIVEAEQSNGDFFIVREKSDLDRRDGIGLIPFIEGAMPLSSSLHILRSFYRLGVKILSFACLWGNDVADGSGEVRSAGLTKFGVEVVKEMNKLGMLIDVSHLSEASTLHVLEVTETPVIATHSNAKTLRDHHRNLSDEVIMKIASKGGVIGLVFFRDFLSEKIEDVTVDHIVDHIDYIKNLVGIDHIGLGPDWTDFRPQVHEVTASLPFSLENDRDAPLDKNLFFTFPEGIEDYTKLPNLTKAILRRGYSEQDLTKILGGNLLRLFKEVWK